MSTTINEFLEDHKEPVLFYSSDSAPHIIFTWSGSATFNVHSVTESAELDSFDCFTRCFTVEGYAPPNDTAWTGVWAWVARHCEAWIEDNTDWKEEKFSNE